MGIPGYSAWFKQKNKSCYIPLSSIKVDHLYIDANSIIHNAMRKARSWEHFHKMLHVKLNNLLEATAPNKTVMVAVDGPAPLAKLLTQRARRKGRGRESKALKKGMKPRKAKKAASAEGTEEEEAEDGSASEAASVDEELSVLTGNAITPGTRFMLDVSLSLLSWACSRASSYKWSHLQIEVSDGTVKGEGEVKILGRMARHWRDIDSNDTHAIVGDDADLILMALIAHHPRLYVINSALNDGRLAPTMPVFSVMHLHEAWAAQLLPKQRPVNLGQASDVEMIEGLKRDLILLTVVAKGNDYLPGLKGVDLSDPQHGLWNTYQKLVKAGSSDVGIVKMSAGRSGRPLLCMDALASLLERCLELCYPGARKPAAGAKKQQQAAAVPSVASSDGGDEDEDAYADDDEEEEEDDDMVGDDDDDDDDEGAESVEGVEVVAGAKKAPKVPKSKKPASCKGYLQGLVWLLDMYLTGESPDYRYYYDGAAPEARDLAALCRQKTAERGSSLLSYADYMPLPPGAESPLVPFAVAMALLPARCSHLLPEAVRPLMDLPTSPIQDIYHECPTCATLSADATQASREVHMARLQVDAVQHALFVARTTGSDKEHMAELEGKLSKAEIELERVRRKTRDMNAALTRHRDTAHKYTPFPIQRLADAAAQVPPSAFPPAERPLTTFGASRVVMRLPRQGSHPLGVSRSLPNTRALSGALRPFPPPASPFVNDAKRVAEAASAGQRFSGPPLARFIVDEPTLAGQAWEAHLEALDGVRAPDGTAAAPALAGQGGGGAAAGSPFPVRLVPDTSRVVDAYVSRPESEARAVAALAVQVQGAPGAQVQRYQAQTIQGVRARQGGQVVYELVQSSRGAGATFGSQSVQVQASRSVEVLAGAAGGRGRGGGRVAAEGAFGAGGRGGGRGRRCGRAGAAGQSTAGVVGHGAMQGAGEAVAMDVPAAAGGAAGAETEGGGSVLGHKRGRGTAPGGPDGEPVTYAENPRRRSPLPRGRINGAEPSTVGAGVAPEAESLGPVAPVAGGGAESAAGPGQAGRARRRNSRKGAAPQGDAVAAAGSAPAGAAGGSAPGAGQAQAQAAASRQPPYPQQGGPQALSGFSFPAPAPGPGGFAPGGGAPPMPSSRLFNAAMHSASQQASAPVPYAGHPHPLPPAMPQQLQRHQQGGKRMIGGGPVLRPAAVAPARPPSPPQGGAPRPQHIRLL